MTLAAATPAAAASADVDMLLIGNSITVGSDFVPGFRDDLYALLEAEPSHTFNWVGSTGDPPLLGHFLGGKEIEDFYPPGFGIWGNGKFDVTPDMGPPNTPNLVAIHLGTNDLNSQPPPFAPYSLDHGQTLSASQSAQLAELLLYLLLWQDGTQSSELQHIVLSLIIPMEGRDQDVADFNEAVIAMSEDFAEGTVTGNPVRITLADHYNHFLTNPDLFTFGPGDWMFDALHPNDAGYTEMATVYHPAIVAAVEDVTAPAAISDLAIASYDSTRIRLTFTASGDDGAVGQAARYDLRADTSVIDAGTFGFSRQVTGEPFPRAGGQSDTLEVTGLLPGTTYHLAVKAVDDGGNRSDISNVVTVTTTGTPTVVLTLREGLDGYFGSEDNTLFDIRPNDNNGNGLDIAVGKHGSGEPLIVDVRRSLIRFDLTSIPANATILEAQLRLFNTIRESPDPVDVAAYRVTKAWVEGTRSTVQSQQGASCWNAARLGELNWSLPGVDAASDAAQNNDPDFDRMATAEDTIEMTTANQWYAWDLTNAVAQWVSGEWQNDGVLVRSLVDAPNNRRFFHSSESTSDPERRPTLVVTLTTEGGTAVVDEPAPVPAVAQLLRAFPNPFNARTSISYELVRAGAVRLGVYDVQGRLVRMLVDGDQIAGSYALEWDGATATGGRAAAGVYFYRLEAAGIAATRKVVLSP